MVFKAAFDEMLADVQADGVSSYDVRIAEIVLEQLSILPAADPQAALSTYGYKQASSISNFAGTLRAISLHSPVEAAVVHGAKDYSDWASLSSDCVDCGIDLLVSDWGIGDTISTHPPFLAQQPGDVRGDVATVLQGLKTEQDAGRLPFSKVVVMTPSNVIAGSVTGALGADVPVSAVLRDLNSRPTSDWDLCDALPSISAPWMMYTDAEHEIQSPFRFPVREADGTVVPIIPFINTSSPYCHPGYGGCQSKVETAKAVVAAISTSRRNRRFLQAEPRGPDLSRFTITPGDDYNHDIAEMNMVYNTEKLRTFCADLATLGDATSAVPTANAYTAYWMGELGGDFELVQKYYKQDRFGLLPAFNERERIPDPSRRRRYERREYSKTPKSPTPKSAKKSPAASQPAKSPTPKSAKVKTVSKSAQKTVKTPRSGKSSPYKCANLPGSSFECPFEAPVTKTPKELTKKKSAYLKTKTPSRTLTKTPKELTQKTPTPSEPKTSLKTGKLTPGGPTKKTGSRVKTLRSSNSPSVKPLSPKTPTKVRTIVESGFIVESDRSMTLSSASAHSATAGALGSVVALLIVALAVLWKRRLVADSAMELEWDDSA